MSIAYLIEMFKNLLDRQTTFYVNSDISGYFNMQDTLDPKNSPFLCACLFNGGNIWQIISYFHEVRCISRKQLILNKIMIL